MQIDHHMGELNNLLKELNISENTMIVFTSDNGCSPEANFKLLAEKIIIQVVHIEDLKQVFLKVLTEFLLLLNGQKIILVLFLKKRYVLLILWGL